MMTRWAQVAGVLSALAPLVVHAQLEAQRKDRVEAVEQEVERPRGRLTKAPKLIYRTEPVYPDSARAEKRTGTTIMRLTIDEEGFIGRVEVLDSAGADLDVAAMGAACGFVFEPAEVDDVPAAIQLDYRQVFTFVEPEPTPPAEQESPPPAATEPENVAPGDTAREAATAVDPGPVNYAGVVRESGTKRALSDAEVSVLVEGEEEPRSVTTDGKGHFELRGVPPGQHLVRVALTGFEPFVSTEDFAADALVKATYFIPRKSYNRFETVVRDRKASKEVNRVVLRREEVSQIPGTFGDPIRAIENMPGMARAPVLGGQLIVRGASPQSTGVYMDGVQIPLLYHFGGLHSVVNAQFLENIDFYPGGFGAQYGRATAGIVDVHSRKLTMGEPHGEAHVDIINSGFFFSSPVTLWGEETASDAPNPRRVNFAVAARRSYVDAIIPLGIALFVPPGVGTLTIAPVYWDYQAKLEYRPVAGHTFSLFGFGSDDYLKVIAGGGADGGGFGISSHTQFHRLVGRWTWNIAPRLTNMFQVYLGGDANNVGFGGGDVAITQDILTSAAGVRNELRYALFDGLGINVGMDAAFASTELQSDLLSVLTVGAGAGGPGGGGGGFGMGLPLTFVNFPRVFGSPVEGTGGGGPGGGVASQPRAENTVNHNVAPYVEAEIGPFYGLRLIPGFRLDYFSYANGTWRLQPNPRLAMRWEPLPGTILKASYGVYEQAPQPTQFSPTTGNPSLRPERARHHIVGIEQRLTPFLTVIANAFYNRREQMVVRSNRSSLADGVVSLERYSNDGIGRSYGADIMLRHDLTKSFYGWIAYTLSRSENRSKPATEWQLFQYDQTHILTLVGQYRLPWHLPFRQWARAGRLPRSVWWNTGWAILSGDVSIGGRWRFVTGNPTTIFTGSINDLDTNEWSFTSSEPRRLPAFHQLDIRVDYKMAFDSWLVNVYLDLINAYNRQNPEAVLWDYRYRTYSTISILPILPSFGLQVEF